MNNNNTQSSPEGVYTPEPRVYELGYLIMPSVDEGNLQNEREALVALITKFKGIVISEEQPQLIDLAYDMSKIIENKKHIYSQGYFGWIKFDVTPDFVVDLTKEVENIESLIRFIMIKTTKENTLVSDVPFKTARDNNSFDEELAADLNDVQPESVPVKTETESIETSSDDLTKIEGIDLKIAEVLAGKGIDTYEVLSTSKVGDLRILLADNDLAQHEPKTWSKQATLAKHGKWDELKALQDELDGGRD